MHIRIIQSQFSRRQRADVMQYAGGNMKVIRLDAKELRRKSMNKKNKQKVLCQCRPIQSLKSLKFLETHFECETSQRKANRNTRGQCNAKEYRF